MPGISIGTKQFLFLFIAIMVVFVSLAAVNYQSTADLFRRQIVEDTKLLVARTNQFLDTYLDNSQNILLLLSARADLLSGASEREVEDYLRSVAENNSTIVKSLYIMKKSGKVFSNTQLTYDIVGNPELPRLYELAQQNYGASVISQPYVSPLSGKTVAITRPIIDKRGETIGAAMVELDLDKLNLKLSELTSPTNQAFLIMSDKNHVVTFDMASDMLPHKPATYRPELPDDFVLALSELSVSDHEIEGPGGPLLSVKSGMNRLGWTLYTFMRTGVLYQSLNELNANYRTAGLALFLALLVVTYMMSRYVSRPLRMLIAKMDRVRDMEVVPNLIVARGDEIGTLARSFTSMMERIRALLQETKEMELRKKEMELKMLQSQINPHFLYNTLACIGSLAKQHRIDEVKETIRALTGVLSFSFDRTAEFVRLEEELEGLRLYVQIQKIRYGDKFEAAFDIDPETADVPILKLTLQPIVENAIFHGIIPSRRSGTIRIHARLRDGALCIVIRDNGIGMPPDKRRTVLRERSQAPVKERLTGIGLRNVHDRLRLNYGERCGLRIRSVPQAGTLVRILIPGGPRQ